MTPATRPRPRSVLIIGSGHMTHNLRDRRPDARQPVAYALEFQAWVDAAIRAPNRMPNPHAPTLVQ